VQFAAHESPAHLCPQGVPEQPAAQKSPLHPNPQCFPVHPAAHSLASHLFPHPSSSHSFAQPAVLHWPFTIKVIAPTTKKTFKTCTRMVNECNKSNPLYIHILNENKTKGSLIESFDWHECFDMLGVLFAPAQGRWHYFLPNGTRNLYNVSKKQL